jgi:hypothetical protein
MAFVPKWYVATSRDRMFLVMNGVPYQTALDLEDGEVLRLGGEFADLAKNGWTHPCDRVAGGLEAAEQAVKNAAAQAQWFPAEEASVQRVCDALQDAAFLKARAELVSIGGKSSFSARVEHPDGQVHATISKFGNEFFTHRR